MGLSQRSVLICSILRITAPFYTPFFLFPPPYSPFPFIFPHRLAYFYQPSSSPSTLRFAKPRFACSFLIACQLWCLMRFVSYLCLCYVCQICASVLVYSLPLLLLSTFCTEKVLDHTLLEEQRLSPSTQMESYCNGLAGQHLYSL